MTGERPSVIVSSYVAGELSREQAAEALESAAWDDSYRRASFASPEDYDGDEFPEEGHAVQVYMRRLAGDLDDADYAAFTAASVRWRAARSGAAG